MIHHPVVQGSDAWLRLRLGIPTASEFSRIITPKELKLAAGRKSYQVELVTELLLDAPLDNYVTPAMIHGKEWEPKARAFYELQEGVEAEECGFCTTDDKRVGASPDAFIGPEGSLEIKCPEKPENHVGYLLHPETLLAEHRCQVQGQLFITGRKWTDLISYFLGLPMVRLRVGPEEKFQAVLAEHLETFLRELEEMKDLARERGAKFPEPKPLKVAPTFARDLPTHAELEELYQRGGVQPLDEEPR